MPKKPDNGVDPILTAQIIAPGWRGRLQYCIDGYACRLGPNVQTHAPEILHWTSESVRDLADDRGWHYSERWHQPTT